MSELKFNKNLTSKQQELLKKLLLITEEIGEECLESDSFNELIHGLQVFDFQGQSLEEVQDHIIDNLFAETL